MWTSFAVGFALALTSAICWAGFDVVRKSVGRDMSAAAAVVGVTFWHVPYLLPLIAAGEAGVGAGSTQPLVEILFVEVPVMSGEYGLLAAGSVGLNLAANFLFLRAVQISPLSLTTPYLAFTPVFSALSAFVVYGEVPTVVGGVGIAVVCAGAFGLNPGHEPTSWWAPLKALWSERGSLYMILVAGLWSITPVLDKAASELTSPVWHTLVLASGVATVFAVGRVIRDGGVEQLAAELGERPLGLVIGGGFAVGALVFQLGSYVYIEIAYVETIKRAIGVLSGILAGWWLFDEREDLGRRLVAALVMAAGVALLLLGG